MRNPHEILLNDLMGKDHLEDLGENGRRVLKQIINK
jgi:hypothetical protein